MQNNQNFFVSLEAGSQAPANSDCWELRHNALLNWLVPGSPHTRRNKLRHLAERRPIQRRPVSSHGDINKVRACVVLMDSVDPSGKKRECSRPGQQQHYKRGRKSFSFRPSFLPDAKKRNGVHLEILWHFTSSRYLKILVQRSMTVKRTRTGEFVFVTSKATRPLYTVTHTLSVRFIHFEHIRS